MTKKSLAKISCVMDASALLAVFNNEPHIKELPKLFQDAIITTFNLAESVSSILVKKGGDEDLLWELLSNFVQNHYPLDDELSYEVIKMTKLTKQYGLSLGDRYCIALAKILNLPVYTADKIWKELESHLKISVVLIR